MSWQTKRRIKLWFVRWLLEPAFIEARKQEMERCERLALVEALARKITNDDSGSDAAGNILWRIRKFQEVDERDVKRARELYDAGELLPEPFEFPTEKNLPD